MRNVSDVITIETDGQNRHNIDVLDLPIYGTPTFEPIFLSKSIFNAEMPTIPINHTNIQTNPWMIFIPLEEDNENITTTNDKQIKTDSSEYNKNSNKDDILDINPKLTHNSFSCTRTKRETQKPSYLNDYKLY